VPRHCASTLDRNCAHTRLERVAAESAMIAAPFAAEASALRASGARVAMPPQFARIAPAYRIDRENR